MDKKKSKIELTMNELEKVSGGAIPNISPEEAKRYILNGIEDHLEIQAVLYYKSFCHHFSASERQTIENRFLDRFGHKPEASPYYTTLCKIG